jgi:hypothetical protein
MQQEAKRPHLRGARAIGDYLRDQGVIGGNECERVKRAYYLLDRGIIPAGKLCGGWLADPDVIDQRISEICAGKRPV